MLSTFALAGTAVMFDSIVAQSWGGSGTPDRPYGAPGAAYSRTASSGFVGLTWGAFLSGAYLSLPKFSPDFVPPVSAAGAITTRWPLAVALSLFGGISAPFLVYIETGYIPPEMKLSERGARIYVPGLAGIVGAMLPWIPALGPKTYRNMLKLERLRLQGAPIPPGATSAPRGVEVGYTFTF